MRDHGPILVPLDGSELAEQAMPIAVQLASGLNERLLLLTVWEGNERDLGETFPSVAAELSEKADEHFSAYLEGVRSRHGDGVRIETKVISGTAGAGILETADEAGARAIVLATHGRSGIGRWMYGSTAGRVLKESHVPVVAVGPHVLERPPADAPLDHLMLTLDGSEMSEQALPVARSLAEKLGAKLSLVRAMPWAVQAYPATLPEAGIGDMDAEMESGAKTYLRKQEEKLKPLDVDAFVVRGPIADGLIDFIEQQRIDLVIMTTHARKGFARALLGSTAERVIQGGAPVLLIPPAAAEA